MTTATTRQHDLQRFVDAQDPVFARVCAELDAGAKTSHWMWFIFPQLKALGRSATARYFGLEDAGQARAYWQHPVLGPRLKLCCEKLLATKGRSALQIFGTIDELKLRSCLTLFAQAAPEAPVFTRVLDAFFDGESDRNTLELMS